MEEVEEREKSKEDLLPQNPKNEENHGAEFELENIEFEEDSDKKKLEFKYQEKNLKDGTVTSKAILETSNNEILIVDEDKGVEHKIEMKKNEKNDSWFVKIQKKIVGTVFKEETIEALQELFSNYRTISKDLRDYSWMSILMACKLIALHDETNKINTTGNTFDNLEEMREINLWWQYSRASFGWQYNLALKFQRKFSGLIDGFLKDTDSINKSIIAENCGISVEDILVTNWTSDLFMPGYYMALDHKQESIVIAIRGSFELKDSLIDLKGHKVSFMGGAVHDGMLVATLKVKQQLDQKFKECKEKYPDYKVICTGYSLGASCAALYTILLLEEYKEIDIHAYCFACPAVLTLDLATKYKRYVTSVLHNKDMVPRVSYGSLEDLKSKIINILKQRAGFIGRSFQIMSGLNFFRSNSKTKLEKFLKTPSQPNCFVDYKPRHSLRLWPPGKVLYMYFTNENGEKKLHVENSHPSLFSNLVISNTMFTDHLPNIYEESLAGCENAIMREIEEKKNKEVESLTQSTSDDQL